MFSAYVKREEALKEGVVFDLRHGGKARLLPYGCPRFSDVMIELSLANELDPTSASFEDKQRIERLALIRGCIVAVYDPDDDRWVEGQELWDALENPALYELVDECKVLSIKRDGFLADTKKKTSKSSRGSKRTSPASKPGARSTRGKMNDSRMSNATRSGAENRAG